jgi:hypothetical protein
MKLSNLIKEQVSERRTKILLSEDQFRRLAFRILSEQEQGTIKNTHLIKTNTHAQKKK